MPFNSNLENCTRRENYEGINCAETLKLVVKVTVHDTNMMQSFCTQVQISCEKKTII